MMQIAASIADEVVVPTDWRCCGYAGDRGMLAPELTANATALEAAEVKTLDGSYFASNNQPCQIALSGATGAEYRSIVEAWVWSVK
jgi:D-lactate dehydrogenase